MASVVNGQALYQLEVAYSNPAVGDIVQIDGPWDTYARIIELKDSGFHLMRGLGHKKPIGLSSGHKDKR